VDNVLCALLLQFQLKTTAFSMKPNFKLMKDGGFFQMLTYVASDAPCSTEMQTTQ